MGGRSGALPSLRDLLGFDNLISAQRLVEARGGGHFPPIVALQPAALVPVALLAVELAWAARGAVLLPPTALVPVAFLCALLELLLDVELHRRGEHIVGGGEGVALAAAERAGPAPTLR